MQSITIRMGAAYHDITVGNIHIDLASASKTDRYEARKALIEGLKVEGYFGTREKRKAIFRSRKAA